MKLLRILILTSLFLMSLAAADQPSETPDTWRSVALQAQALLKEHKFAAAAEMGERALRLAKRFGPTDRRLASTHHMLGIIYRDWGHCGESRSNYSRAIAIWRQQKEPTQRYLFNSMSNLISVTCECDDFAAAEKAFKAYEPELRRYRSDSLDDARLLSLQAVMARNRKQYDRAEAYFLQAVNLMEHEPEATPLDVAAERASLGVIYDKQGRYAEALIESQKAIAFFESNAPMHPALMASYNNAACSLAAMGRRTESERMFERALEMGRQLFGEDNHVTAKIMLSYARVLRENKEAPAAAIWQKRGSEAFHRSLARNTSSVDVEELRKK